MRKKERKTRSWHASESSSHPEEEIEQVLGEVEDADMDFGASEVQAASERMMLMTASIEWGEGGHTI